MCLFYVDNSKVECLCLTHREVSLSNYTKGANFERLVKKQLETDGCFVVKSGGSRGKVDLLAINKLGEKLFIQCKLHGIISNSEKDALLQLALEYSARAFVVEKLQGNETKWLELT